MSTCEKASLSFCRFSGEMSSFGAGSAAFGAGAGSFAFGGALAKMEMNRLNAFPDLALSVIAEANSGKQVRGVLHK